MCCSLHRSSLLAVGGSLIAPAKNPGVSQDKLLSQQERPAAEFDGSGKLVARYVYGTRGNVPELMVRADGVYRFVVDERGSVRLVVKSDGVVVHRRDYDAWGEVTKETGTALHPFGYAGGLYDGAIGLVRFGARDYDPSLGRWLAKDPDLLDDGMNVSAYGDDDPIDFQDPSGLASCINGECFSKCIKGQGVGYALALAGIDAPFASLVPKFGRDARLAAAGAEAGVQRLTTVASWTARGMKSVGLNKSGILLRKVGRRLNPAANVILGASLFYSATSAAVCALDCRRLT